ncbi:MAG TPA: hypothetical protein VK875_03900 [Euzebyales bacterium]|nr:hypothetical protein [Euzebyales bacterium]
MQTQQAAPNRSEAVELDARPAAMDGTEMVQHPMTLRASVS